MAPRKRRRARLSLAKVDSNTHIYFQAKSDSVFQVIFMTNPAPSSLPPKSINDDLPTSSPSPRSMLIGISCVAGVVLLFAAYYNIIGF
jgi:hypothetical protein